MNVGDPVGHVLADLLAHALRGVTGGAFAMAVLFRDYFFSAWAALRGPLRVRALVRVRWPRIGRPGDGGNRGSNRCPSTLDVHGCLAAQVAFDRELADLVADAFQVVVSQVLDLLEYGIPVASQILRARARPMPKMAVRPISAC